MQVNVIGRHMSLGDDQVQHAETEAEKLGKFFDGVNGVQMTFELEHADTLKAEIICTVSGGKTLIAHEKGRTIHEALEAASDNMVRQLKKYKAKLHDHRLHGTPSAPAEESEDEDEFDDAGFAEDE